MIEIDVLKEFSLLVIEDEHIVAESLEKILEKYFKLVITAPDGKEGIEKFKEHKCDIVLTDISMPKLDGMGMIPRLKEINPFVQIVIMTARSTIKDCSEAIKLGVCGYISKPLTKDNILNTLTKAAKVVINSRKAIENANLLNQYKKAVDMTSIVSKTDTRGIITYVNDRFCDVSGYTRDELIGKNHNIIRHQDTPSEVFRVMWETIKQKQTWSGVVKNRTKSGGSYIVDTTIFPILDTDNNIVEYMSIRHDITLLQSMLIQAESAKRAKEEFLANMSHEIRTPLNAILGFVEFLKETQMDNEQQKYLETIHKSGKVLLNVINDVLDMSKIERGKLQIERIPFDLTLELSHVMELFSANAKEKGVLLEQQLGRELPHCIKGDFLRLKQIISNLLSNAIKFTPAGKRVTLFADFEKESSLLSISVQDEGIGISPEAKVRIFEAFEQNGATTARRYGGTGLGLSICSKLVELLGGRLDVESTLGEGSRFFFSIPIEEADCSEVEKQQTKKTEYDKKAFVSKRVLVAEDNEANQFYLKTFLLKLGIVPTIANNGLEALELFSNLRFDLILMDEQMPNLNGIETTKKILEIEQIQNRSHTPIVALTARALKGEKDAFLQAGVDDFLSKPIDTALFMEVLAKYMGSSIMVSETAPAQDGAPKKMSIDEIAKKLELHIDETASLLEVFKRSINESMERLLDGINNKDYEKILKSAHKIAGSMAHAMGIPELNRTAKKIERAAEEQLEIEYRVFYNQLKEMLERIP